MRFWTIVVLIVGFLPTGAFALVSTSIVYQGVLSEGQAAASGSYDMEFTLWDAESGGAIVGATLTRPGVNVSDGRFSVELDWGRVIYGVEPELWLEVFVDSFRLSPRQRLSASPFSLQTRGIVVDDLENVGIGTTAPQANLHIDGTGSSSVGFDVTSPGASSGRIRFGSPRSHVGISGDANNGNRRDVWFMDQGLGLFTAANSLSPFAGNGLLIDENGDVGIGTIAPEARLNVISDHSAKPAIRATTPPGGSITRTIWASAHGVGSSAVLGENEGGGIGVRGGSENGFAGIGVFGSSLSPEGVGVAGDSVTGVQGTSRLSDGTGVHGKYTVVTGAGVGVRGTCRSTTGFDFLADGVGANYGATSSRRWKRNIEAIEQPLDVLSALRGVTFDWDDEHGGHHDIGMIAEEVGAVLPEIVAYEANEVDAIGMDCSKLSPLLVSAVNALRAEKDSEIASVRAENEALRERLSSLEALVTSLAGQQKEDSR